MRIPNRIVWPIAALFMALGGITTLWAIDASTALYRANITHLNLGLTRENFPIATEISGSALIDDAFMAADTLNAVVHEGPVEIPSMPPNNRIVVEGSVVDDGGSFTEFTTEARNATELDVALLPATPGVGDAHYFGCDNPCRIISIDVGQEGIGDWALEWEYFNGTAFVTASNVDDRTQAFTLAGRRTVSFDMPSDMATTTVTGSAVEAFWVRARVDSVSTSSQQAIGNQLWYENGQWWQWGKSQSINEQLLYTLSVGGPDQVTHHQLFPGDAGIVTADDASIELGDSYNIHIEGSVNLTAGVTGSTVCIVCKDGAIRLYISDVDEITLDVTGAGTTSLSLGGIPDAVDQATTTTPHVIDIISDGTDLSLTVDGVGTVSGSAQTVVDNGNDWQWGSNRGVVFFDTVYIFPDETALAFELFDAESDWDTGTFVNTVSTGGQADLEHHYNPFLGSEDGYWQEGSSGFVNTAENLRFGFQGGGANTSANAFIRFDNVRLDPGETITAANLRLNAFATNSTATVNVRISAIDEDDASAPSTFAGAEGATRTAAFTDWNAVPSFTAGAYIDSVDIATVVQEVIDRPGWTAGNAIVVFIEDNGSTAVAGTEREACAWEGNCLFDGTPVKLQVTTSAATFTDDFIELESFLADGDDIPGWTITCGGCREAHPDTDEAEHYGRFALDLDEGTTTGTNARAQQTISGVSAGEVWSFGFGAMHTSSNDDTGSLIIRFRDSGNSTLSTTTVAIPVDAGGWTIYTADGITAPASTDNIFLEFETACDSGPQTCTSGGTDTWIDGVIACIAPTAPTFPDSCNRVSNPSFENVYSSSGTWITPTINLSQTNVTSSLIAWDSFAPFDGTLIVETSIDGQATWQTATNGEAISGISEGDDLTGGTLHVRVTITPGTPSTLDSQVFSPFMSLLALVILDDVDEDNTILYYQLRTTPGVTIEDLSPNFNDGTMSYPIQLSGIFSSIGVLQSNRTPLSQQAAIGVGDFAAPVSGSEANLNLFGQDDGSSLPGGEVISTTASDLGFPVAFFWITIVMIAGIALGAAVWTFSNGSELMVSIVLAGTLVLAAALGDGLIPGWVPFVAIAMLVAYSVLRSRLPI